MQNITYLVIVDPLGTQLVTELSEQDTYRINQQLARFNLDIISRVSWELLHRLPESVKSLGRYQVIYCNQPEENQRLRLFKEYNFEAQEKDMEELILSFVPQSYDKKEIEVYSGTFNKVYFASCGIDE